MRLGLNRTLRHLGRGRHILAVLTKHGFAEAVASFRGKGPRGMAASEHRGKTRPQRFRMALEEMGPTFVKFGQLLATRPDLLSFEYVHELEQLQDRVHSVPFGRIREMIEAELAGKLEDHFSRFDHRPVAAGSIAQVHSAVTKDGDVVAVKVRRPDVVQTVRIECEILEDLAGLIKRVLAADDTIDPVQLVGEFTEAIRKETDLANELRNLQRFERNFRDDPTVHIPRAYPKYCTAGVLTMEFIEGVKPRSRQDILDAGCDPDLVAQRSAEFVLRQVFDFGFFHTDPHPGNLMVTDGSVVAVMDFGQAVRFGSRNQVLLGELVLAIVEQDAEGLVHAFAQEDMLTEQTDVVALSGDVEELLDAYASLPLNEIPFGQMMGRTFDLIRRHRVRPPPAFSMMLKSLMTIESLSTGLDSEFRLVEQLKPYARRLRLQQLDPRRIARRAHRAAADIAEMLGEMPGYAGAILRKARSGKFRLDIEHKNLDRLVTSLDKSSDRVSFALIIAGLLISSSMLVTQEGQILGLVRLETLGVLGYCVAAVLGVWLLVSILRGPNV
jgi:ubiquinone biosynthesis protein